MRLFGLQTRPNAFNAFLKTVCIFVLLILTHTNSLAEKRFALVIGNSNYQAVGSLRNANNDAQLIASSFKAVGFETVLLTDLSKESMGKALDRLADRVGSLDVVAVYYAGHAVQKDGQNYLIPIDAQIKTQPAIERETIALQSIMKILERVPISLLFLDACRNNPFAQQITNSSKSGDRSIVIQQGLAVVRPIGDILITFATLPNAVAFDGDGDNSPFARSLSQHMKTPNVEVSVLMKRVTRGVVLETSGKQRPQQLSQMQSEFYFAKNSSSEFTRDEIKSVLSIYPAQVTDGDEVALVADVPNSCIPTFFDLAKNGKETPIPIKFFKQIVLNSGQSRFEISPGSRFGLIVEEQDPRGIHTMGYFCESQNLRANSKAALLTAIKANIDRDVLQGKVRTASVPETQYHFQRYEVR